MAPISDRIAVFILIAILASLSCSVAEGKEMVDVENVARSPIIMTVRGPIDPGHFGRALVHEHISVDFIGAKETGPHRWNANSVIKTMLPYLRDLRERQFSGFVDATPAWIGRDVQILQRLSELSGLHIVTNTGIYGAAGDKYVPAFAYAETADQLAGRFVKEWTGGIEGTGIRPGFIKTGVDAGPLSEIDRKLLLASARAHLKTGLPIACHTGEATAALAVVDTIAAEGVRASALIIVHADAIQDMKVHLQMAKAGVWLEYDGVSDGSIDKHVRLIKMMIAAGFIDQLLLSHDAGWYSVGQPSGAKESIRHYNTIVDKLIPALQRGGLLKTQIHKLLVESPAKAFAIKTPSGVATTKESP